MMAIQQENLPGSQGGGTGGGRGGRGGAAAAPTAAAPAEGRGGSTRVPGHLIANEEEFEHTVQPDTQAPSSAHGFLARAKVDQEHWITSGVPETVYAMVSGSTIYTPIKEDRGVNAAVYAPADQVMASGYSWDEYRKQLAFKPLEVVERDGRGNEIGFTTDPNYRGCLDGLNLLFINAVFRGPAHTGGGFGGAEEEK
jgi:hypothetical protein